MGAEELELGDWCDGDRDGRWELQGLQHHTTVVHHRRYGIVGTVIGERIIAQVFEWGRLRKECRYACNTSQPRKIHNPTSCICMSISHDSDTSRSAVTLK